jgi:hypothetical protein
MYRAVQVKDTEKSEEVAVDVTTFDPELVSVSDTDAE